MESRFDIGLKYAVFTMIQDDMHCVALFDSGCYAMEFVEKQKCGYWCIMRISDLDFCSDDDVSLWCDKLMFDVLK